MKIQSKFILSVFSLLVFVVVGGGLLQIATEKRLLVRETEQHNRQTLSRLTHVCEESLIQGNNLLFFNYLSSLKTERGFVAASFVDSNGVVQIHSDPREIGKNLRAENEDAKIYSSPVVYAGSRVGTAYLEFDKKIINDHIRQSLMESIRRIGLVMILSLLAGLAGALWLSRTLIRPIRLMVDGMRKVSKGVLEPVAVPKRKDELGWMGQELNSTIRKLKELEDMKRNFFSRITHELRSPLSAISGFTTLLMKGRYGSVSSNQQDVFLTMHNSTNRLSRLVDDLLTTSKLEEKSDELEVSKFDLNEAINSVYKLYSPLAHQKGLSMKLSVAQKPMNLSADYEKVIHILNNLVSNALKYTQQGGIELRAKKNGQGIRIEVADSGPGIQEEERSKIFDRFYRSKSVHKNQKGTGLGLSIVQSLVELHGGRIQALENPGGGTVFSITFPNQL